MTTTASETQSNENLVPEVQGQSETSKATMRVALETMTKMASEATDNLDSRTGSAHTVEHGNVVPLPTKKEEEDRRIAIIEKVGRFLDTKMHGPMFVGSARGKLFIGEYPRQQDLLDVQLLVGNRPNENLSVGEVNVAVIGELRKILFGWMPIASPKVQVLRANIDRREEWEKLDIKLNRIEWMESRDPYVIDEEVTPLWRQYMKWRVEVEPTKEDFDFYYGLM
jgi:hypothetical protein